LIALSHTALRKDLNALRLEKRNKVLFSVCHSLAECFGTKLIALHHF